MSYWVYLQCPHCERPLPVENHEEGGNYVLGGTDEATVNVTYNYCRHFAEALGYLDDPKVNSFRDYLDGKRASDVLAALEDAIEKLGTERAEDYWQASEGNAGHALSILANWARQHPEGVFRVS